MWLNLEKLHNCSLLLISLIFNYIIYITYLSVNKLTDILTFWFIETSENYKWVFFIFTYLDV